MSLNFVIGEPNPEASTVRLRHLLRDLESGDSVATNYRLTPEAVEMLKTRGVRIFTINT